MKSRKLVLAVFLCALSAVSSAFAAPLSLESYLDQVTQKNTAVEASRISAEGALYRAEGASVLTFPYLFGEYGYLNDRQETVTPAFQGSANKTNTYTIGIGTNTDFGLNASYSFNVKNTDIFGASPAFLPTPNYYTSYNQISVRQSLVKNGFGSETRAQKDLIEYGNKAQSLSNEYRYHAQLAQAETAYWRLSLARRAVEVQDAALGRAERTLQWAKRRVGLQLADKSDLLQAQASYDLKRLDLSSALEEERQAARAFNLMRQIDSEKVSEQLPVLTVEDTLKIRPVLKKGIRLDTAAAIQNEKVQIAQAQIDKERLKPSLDLVASHSWTGRDAQRGSAVSEAFGSKNPITQVGVSFTLPLNVPTWKKAIDGANLQMQAASLDLENIKLTEKRDWQELENHYEDAAKRLALLRTVEEVQKEKAENERQRLLRGRTTTFQALQYEQEYSATQLLRLRTQLDLLNTVSQMKLYRGEE